MSLKVNLKIKEEVDGDELPAIAKEFVSASYTQTFQETISLTGGSKADVKTNLSSISFIYVERTGDSTDVTIYRNVSPTGWEFDRVFLAYDLEGVTAIALKADADTTVKVFLAN